ncbi:MAG: biotin/lipoate A/B protein ligase family protein [Gemmatimonadota bacterium]|jgi:lipoate-protein ligase A
MQRAGGQPGHGDGRATQWRCIIGDGTEGAPRAGVMGVAGAMNMAIDQALMESVRGGAPPTLRLYRWTPGCLSFGRNQPARGRYDPAAAATRGIDIVRRPTGGLAVYHDRELTYAVAAPVSVIGKPRAAYKAINRALAAGLRRLGVPVVLVREGGPGGMLGSGPCFHEGAPGEVLVEGKKLVGSAQRCESRTILQHGSLLLEGDQAEVLELELLPQAEPIDDRRSTIDDGPGGVTGPGPATSSGVTAASPVAPLVASSLAATSLAAVLGSVPEGEALVAALVAGFEEELGVVLEPGVLTDGERARARELESHYRSDDWTWRR